MAEMKIENGVLVSYYGTEKELVIPSGVKEIGKGAFMDNRTLTDITIPEGVVTIEESAFDGCSALKRITLPESLRYIGDLAFNGCIGLTEIHIPENVEAIASDAFDGTDHVTSVTFPLSWLEKERAYVCQGDGGDYLEFADDVFGLNHIGNSGTRFTSVW